LCHQKVHWFSPEGGKRRCEYRQAVVLDLPCVTCRQEIAKVLCEYMIEYEEWPNSVPVKKTVFCQKNSVPGPKPGGVFLKAFFIGFLSSKLSKHSFPNCCNFFVSVSVARTCCCGGVSAVLPAACCPELEIPDISALSKTTPRLSYPLSVVNPAGRVCSLLVDHARVHARTGGQPRSP